MNSSAILISGNQLIASGRQRRAQPALFVVELQHILFAPDKGSAGEVVGGGYNG